MARTKRRTLLVPANAADERYPFVVGPAAKLFKFLIIDEEMRGTAGTDDGLLAVTPRLAPFEHAAECVAIPFAQMIDDYANRVTEWIIPSYPGSESIMLGLRVGSPDMCVENDCADEGNNHIFSLCRAIVNWRVLFIELSEPVLRWLPTCTTYQDDAINRKKF